MSRNKNNTKSTTPRDVNAGMRVTQALELRAKKLTYDEIATQCGYSDRASCYRAVQRELDRRVVHNVDEMRKQEADMLDQLHTVCWEMAIDKSNKGRLFAVDRVLAISERRAKLMGLDVKIDDAQNANLVVIREVPNGYLEGPKSV
jgi:hypothetical protein